MRNRVNLQRLTDSSFAILGADGATNFGIVRARNGDAMLIDADIRRIDEIRLALEQAEVTRVRYLFNTHENFDHSSANQHFDETGAVVIASDGCLAALLSDGEAKFAEMSSRSLELKKRFPALKMGLPGVTFSHNASLHFSGAAVRLIYRAYRGKSHSRGDAVALLEDERVLFAGDLLYTEVHPVTVYADIQNWIHSLTELATEDYSCVVPGHGPVVYGSGRCREAFIWFRDYLEDFYRQLLKIRSGERTAAEVEAYMKAGAYAPLGKAWMVKRNIEHFVKRREAS